MQAILAKTDITQCPLAHWRNGESIARMLVVEESQTANKI
jgi:hypothetical protein